MSIYLYTYLMDMYTHIYIYNGLDNIFEQMCLKSVSISACQSSACYMTLFFSIIIIIAEEVALEGEEQRVVGLIVRSNCSEEFS